MDVTMYLDGDPEIRESAHREHEITTLKARVKELEFDCAELRRGNVQLNERIKKLAAGKPRQTFGKRKSFNSNNSNKTNYRNRTND